MHCAPWLYGVCCESGLCSMSDTVGVCSKMSTQTVEGAQATQTVYPIIAGSQDITLMPSDTFIRHPARPSGIATTRKQATHLSGVPSPLPSSVVPVPGRTATLNGGKAVPDCPNPVSSAEHRNILLRTQLPFRMTEILRRN